MIFYGDFHESIEKWLLFFEVLGSRQIVVLNINSIQNITLNLPMPRLENSNQQKIIQIISTQLNFRPQLSIILNLEQFLHTNQVIYLKLGIIDDQDQILPQKVILFVVLFEEFCGWEHSDLCDILYVYLCDWDRDETEWYFAFELEDSYFLVLDQIWECDAMDILATMHLFYYISIYLSIFALRAEHL